MATTIMPHLNCRNAAQALEFYQKAFGATPRMVMNMPDGRLMHAGLDFGNGATVMLADEFPEHGGHSPQSLGGTPVTIHLQVDDCDAVFDRAVKAGCTVRMPLENMFWGDRYGMVTDPYGHCWSIATTVGEFDEKQMHEMMKHMGAPCG